MTQNIVITYPPDFDGELHIKADAGDDNYTFTFTHTTHSGKLNVWETLVEAARGILAMERRIVNSK